MDKGREERKLMAKLFFVVVVFFFIRKECSNLHLVLQPDTTRCNKIKNEKQQQVKLLVCKLKKNVAMKRYGKNIGSQE